MIHANHAGTAWPRPPGVAEAMRAALAATPVEQAALHQRAHAAVAAWFGLPAPERLLFASSCTAALGVLLADLPWQRGDVVITSQLEHHALVRPVQALVQHRGVRHVAAPWRPGVPLDLDAVAAALAAGRVRLVAVTGASNVTGERLPLAELAALAHAHGALFLLDAAQVAGVVPLDLEALGVDLLAFAGHKGLGGPPGVGGLWAARHVTFACPGVVCELGGGGAPRIAPYPGHCDLGSVNLPGVVGLAAALAWLDALPAADRERPVRLAARLRAALRERPHVRVLGGDGPHTGAVGMLVRGGVPRDAEAHFAARGIVVRAGSHCAPMALEAVGAPGGCLRIGFGTGNRDEDVDAVLAALDTLPA